MTQAGYHTNSAVFFDRDGVLNIDRGYVYRKEDFEWVRGAKEALRYVNSRGYLSIIVTNQSGVAREFYTLSDMLRLHDWMREEALLAQARIDDFYYCPYHNEGSQSEFVIEDHPDRKPNPGMILRASRDHNIDLKSSVLIGDKASDIEAANRAGVQSILFNGEDLFLTVRDWFEAQSY
jgi:D-glycero-D-manno-heptose 1,7-bisphosphate phosphatase